MKRSILFVGLTMLWTSTASAGYLLVDKKQVEVPFHVVHGFFDFEELHRQAADEASATGKTPDDEDEDEDEQKDDRTADRLIDLSRAHGRPYVVPREGGAIQSVDLLVLHTTLTYDARTVVPVLMARGLSTHLLVDWDGTIYQLADVGLMALHAGEVNQRSVGIDLINPMVNEKRKGSNRTYDPKRERQLTREGHKRPVVTGTIHGQTVRTTGYTKAQLRSTYALARALVAIFPNLPATVPRGPDKKVLWTTAKDVSKLKGVVAHWHTSENRWDPGPGIDWDALEKGLK
jgi:hypothetical protein